MTCVKMHVRAADLARHRLEQDSPGEGSGGVRWLEGAWELSSDGFGGSHNPLLITK
jgi:hypothetical protein